MMTKKTNAKFTSGDRVAEKLRDFTLLTNDQTVRARIKPYTVQTYGTAVGTVYKKTLEVLRCLMYKFYGMGVKLLLSALEIEFV